MSVPKHRDGYSVEETFVRILLRDPDVMQVVDGQVRKVCAHIGVIPGIDLNEMAQLADDVLAPWWLAVDGSEHRLVPAYEQENQK